MTDIEYRLVYSDKAKKNVTVRIAEDATIEVRAPRGVSRDFIEQLLEGNRALLERRQAEYRAFLERKSAFTLTYGASAPMLGTDYFIYEELGTENHGSDRKEHRGASDSSLIAPFFCRAGRFDRGFFLVAGLSPEQVERALADIYSEAARRYMPVRTAEIAEELGIECPPVRITSAKNQWGSCTHDRRRGDVRICYSWRLMLASPRAVDSVIVHELCHISDSNHGDRFWRHVKGFMPDYPVYAAELKRLAAVMRERFHI